MKNNEIIGLSITDIESMILTKKIELSRLKINHKVAQVENPISIRNLRKDIARLLTNLTKKQSQA